jgi:hypothetical protein
LIVIEKCEKVRKRDKKWLPTTMAWHFHCQS